MELTTHSRDMGGNFEKEITLAGHNETLVWHIVIADRAPETARIRVRLTGKNSSCRIVCAYVGAKTMRSDISMTVEHVAQGTASRVGVRAVLDDAARLTWRGTLTIGKKAAHADAALSIKALLLSDNAMAFLKPDLEILHDEVLATHGASVGKVSPKDLFYFASRGVPEHKAQHAIAEGFLREVMV
ncbi:MAG: SufD family Fe-S cluster assembly protein [Patescibacteria group bacterium]